MHVIGTNLVFTRTVLVVLIATFMVTLIPLSIQAQPNTLKLSPQNSLDFTKHTQIQLGEIESLLSKKDYDAAELVVNELFSQMKVQQNTTMFADIYIMAGRLYYQQKKYDDAIVQYQKSASFIKGTDDDSKKLLALTFHEIAQCYKRLNNVPESIINYQESLSVHTARQDSLSIAKALKNIAMAENKQKNYIKALDHAHRSLTILSSDSSSPRYAQVALATGIIYRNIGDYEKSLDLIQQAKKIYEQENDVRHLAEVDNQIGLIYTDLHQLDNALSFYYQTVNLPNARVKPETRAAAFRELGVISYHQGNLETSINMFNAALRTYQSIASRSKTTRIDLLLGRSYLKKKNYAIATHYFEQSLALAVELEQIEFQVQSLNYLGQIMLNEDAEQATSLLERSLTLSSKVDNKDDRMMTYHWLKESEKVKGNLAKSIEYSDKKFQLSQEIKQEREALDFTKNQVILDSYKLEIELNDLRENAEVDTLKLTQQQNEIAIMQQSQQIAALEIKRNRFANLLLITALSVFILAVLYILYRYRNTRAKNRELHYLASRDPLTHCYNRRILYQRFNKSVESKESLKQYSVLLAEIDSFKTINDNYGHSTGDKVLQGVAKILLNNANEDDTVARFGGEGFCILLPNSTIQEAEIIAEKIRYDIEKNTFESMNVTCSFGVASLNNETEFNLTLIERADMALYQSKYDGINRVTLWDHQTMKKM